jgi:hypothetical protein
VKLSQSGEEINLLESDNPMPVLFSTMPALRLDEYAHRGAK